MKLGRSGLLLASIGLAAAASTLSSHDAQASVSIAVAFDALVKDADAVALITPQESKSVWEEGRIYTYTKVKIDKGIAGDTGTGETWIRTMGGVVEKIGQLVDGEPVLVPGKQNLLFIRKWKTSSTWEVSARAQGQYPVVADDKNAKLLKVIRSGSVGSLLPPKPKADDTKQGSVQIQSAGTGRELGQLATVRLAADVMHDKPLDDVTREIVSTWKTAHPTPAK